MSARQKMFTYCRICEASCGFVAEVSNNKIVKYYPDKDHPVSKGYACVKGLKFLDIQYHPKRVKQPFKRIGDKYEKISWETAIEEIGGKLRQILDKNPPNSVAAYMGNPIAFSYSMALYGLTFMKLIGSQNLFTVGSQDCNNKFAHSEMFYGSPTTIVVPDFDNIDYLLALGTNPLASHFSFVVFPNPLKRLKQMEKRGCKIVWINPRKMEAAQKIGEHYFIYPNSDVFLLFGMINYVLENNLEDKEFINTYSKGINKLRQIAKEFGGDLDRVSELTGIEKEAIVKITNDFLKASKKGGASVYGRVGKDRGPFATMLAWAIDVLNFITGNIDKKGNFYSKGLLDLSTLYKMSTNPRGLVDIIGRINLIFRLMHVLCKEKGIPGALSTMAEFSKAALRQLKAKGERKGSRIGNFPPLLESYPAAIMADEIITPGKDSIKAMIVIAGDPLLSCPNAIRLKRAFGKLELLVSVDYFINDTGLMADYILPAKTFLEREDFSVATSAFNPAFFANYTKPVVKPEGDVKGEWEIFNLLQEKMGLPTLGDSPLALVRAILQKRERKRFDKLLESEKGIFLDQEKRTKYDALLPQNIKFRDKLVPLVPDDYEREFDKFRKWEFKRDGDYPLYLISGRQVETLNSWINCRKGEHFCYINSSDADELSIHNGDTIKVSTKIGSIEILAQLTDDLMRSVIWIPYGWGRTNMASNDAAVEKRGTNVNLITDDDWRKLETFAGMVMLDGIPVKIEKL